MVFHFNYIFLLHLHRYPTNLLDSPSLISYKTIPNWEVSTRMSKVLNQYPVDAINRRHTKNFSKGITRDEIN
jgi:hypothetical protein